MNTPTFAHIEEYVEFIGGYRDSSGKRLGLFEQVPSPLSLARYDVNIVSSLASQTAESSNPYTDKQALLAIKLVDKYRKQLANLNPAIFVPEQVDKMPFRLGIRQVDRTKKTYIEDDKFVVKFPYDTKLIDLMKRQTREGQGGAQFDNDNKVWKMAMTEHNLNWIMAVCPGFDFEIDNGIKSLYDKMLEVESRGFDIQLDIVNGVPVISNASASLLEYINNNIGELSLDNLTALVDNSEVLGYTVSPAVKEVIKIQYPDIQQLIRKRRVTVKKDNGAMDKVLDYARKTNRLPIHVYDTGLPKTDTEEIKYLNRGVSYEVAPKVLVTTTSLMIGSRKESWMNNAEKIIIIE